MILNGRNLKTHFIKNLFFLFLADYTRLCLPHVSIASDMTWHLDDQSQGPWVTGWCTMELKVWVDGVQRIVCGVTEVTTCQEVVIALAQAIGKWNFWQSEIKWFMLPLVVCLCLFVLNVDFSFFICFHNTTCRYTFTYYYSPMLE